MVLETYIFHIQTYIYEKKDTTIFVGKDENVATTVTIKIAYNQ